MNSLATGVLLTWRITSLLNNESGPFDIFGQVRDLIGVEYDQLSRCQGQNEVAKAVCCTWCLSIWVAFAIVLLRRESVFNALVYSAGAILVETFIRRK